MPQMGLHLCLGILPVKYDLLGSRLCRMGFLIGSVIPDFDFALLIPIYPIDRETALSVHRSLSHSILAFGGLFVISLLLRLITRLRPISGMGIGIGIGMGIHSFLDILMWFAPVYLLWPAPIRFSVFQEEQIPEFAWNLSFAAEPVSYTLFLILLARTARIPCGGSIKLISLLLLIISLVLSIMALYFPRLVMEPLSYGFAIVIGFGSATYYAVRSWHRLFPYEKADSSDC